MKNAYVNKFGEIKKQFGGTHNDERMMITYEENKRNATVKSATTMLDTKTIARMHNFDSMMMLRCQENENDAFWSGLIVRPRGHRFVVDPT